MSKTLQWYNHNALLFLQRSSNRIWPDYYRPFLNYLPENGHLLEVGCGPGKDVKMFLDHGFTVSAFDASEELVKMAKEYTGINIACHTFDEVDADQLYDGIWASASFLHISSEDFIRLVPKYIRALKMGGVWHMSFKHGEGEKERKGRYFQDYTEESLQALLEKFPMLSILHLDKVPDSRLGKAGEFWTCAVVRRMD